MTPETGEPDERIAHPNRGTLGQPPFGGGDHLYLSATQLHDHENDPSWKAPREGGMSTAAWITVVIAAGAAILVAFWATGVI